MKSYEQLAVAAYQAYCKQYGGKELDGSRVVDMPAWGDLDPQKQEAWHAAVKQVVADYAAIH
jgi:hypothetical protein